MQTPKTRSGSSEVPQKVSPRAVRQLKTSTTIDTASVFSSQPNNKISKEKSPKVTDRKSPRSPVPERKRPSKISELESQLSQLQEDLKKVKDQLILSESCKKQAEKDSEESKEKLSALSAKLEESQKQLQELQATGEARQKVTEERNTTCQSTLSLDSASLASAVDEIQNLKVELQLVVNYENVQIQNAESSNLELLNLKQNLSETLSLVENMKRQFKNFKESEAQAQALVNQTISRLEDAKRNAEILSVDVVKNVECYKSIALELDKSRARVNSLEEFVRKFRSENCKIEKEFEALKEEEDPNVIEAEIDSLKSEVGRLRSAVETAETKYQEEQIRSAVQIRNAYELMEQMKCESGNRECELETELKRKKTDIEELKANLMDKETELQGIVEENENLNLKLEENMKTQNENNLGKEIKRLEECVAELKRDLMDKETTLQSISEENETLKMEINKREEVEGVKAAEHEALAKLRIAMEEADRSNRKAARVAEQLEAAQAVNSEMEAELRRLKVQSDQWRKAAEAAAAMLNNGKLTERTVSLDNNYKCSPFADEIDDDFQRKKNGNVLKKIGVLWKKPQK